MDFAIQQLQLGKTLTNKRNADQSLDIVKKAGFNGIELNGFMIRKSPFIVKVLTDLYSMPIKNSGKLNWKELVDTHNLKVVSIHEDIGTLENKIDMVIEECHKYNTDTVVLTGLYQYEYGIEDKVRCLAERLNKIGERLSKENISFLYHNHNVEFVKVSREQRAYDIIVENTNPDYVNFEFDSFWASTSGADAISYMRKLGSRQKLHHICDNGNLSKKEFLTPIIKMNAVELGEGTLNLEELLKIDMENQVKYVILEQHQNYIHENPLESLSLSGDYLKSMARILGL